MSDEDFKKLYCIWINKIVRKLQEYKNGYTTKEGGWKEVVEHMKHHFEELDSEHEGFPTLGWLVSMSTLIDICAKILNKSITYKICVERLYEHWLKDPEHSESPPVEHLLLSKKEEYISECRRSSNDS